MLWPMLMKQSVMEKHSKIADLEAELHPQLFILHEIDRNQVPVMDP